MLFYVHTDADGSSACAAAIWSTTTESALRTYSNTAIHLGCPVPPDLLQGEPLMC